MEDRGAWPATVHGVEKSRTQLSVWTTTTSIFGPQFFHLWNGHKCTLKGSVRTCEKVHGTALHRALSEGHISIGHILLVRCTTRRNCLSWGVRVSACQLPCCCPSPASAWSEIWRQVRLTGQPWQQIKRLGVTNSRSGSILCFKI